VYSVRVAAWCWRGSGDQGCGGRWSAGKSGRATTLKAAVVVAAVGAVYIIEGGACDYQQTVSVELRIAGAHG
jgi:hypothetical protein